MGTKIISKLNEWTVLESAHYRARLKDCPAARGHLTALIAKEREILDLRPQTKSEVLAQLRFCATFLERNGDKGELAAAAIRNAANVLFRA